MSTSRHLPLRSAIGLGLLVAFAAACNNASPGLQISATAAPTPRAAPSPTPESTSVPVPAAPAPTTDARQQAFGSHSPLPLSGEFAVTANMDDHTLSVVPIGAATVATTVRLDLAPRSIGVAPNSDTVLAADGAPAAHGAAIASLNSSAESGTLDLGVQPEAVAAPSPNSPSGPLAIVSQTDNTIRPVNPETRALGPAVQLGAGPHRVNISGGNSMLSPQVYVGNAGDGTVSVLDPNVTTVTSTLHVGGTPVGVVRTIDGRLWVADGEAGTVTMFDAASGDRLQTVKVGPELNALAATPDGHYLVLASARPDMALYAVDLVNTAIGGSQSSANAVRHLAVPGGVLALATGAEIGRAYVTTGDGNLLYWDLASNAIDQTIPVGHNPVGLTLGLVEPSGGVSTPAGGGATTGSTGLGSIPSTSGTPGTVGTGSTGSAGGTGSAGIAGNTGTGGAGLGGTSGASTPTSGSTTGAGAAPATGATGTGGAAPATGATGASSSVNTSPSLPTSPPVTGTSTRTPSGP